MHLTPAGFPSGNPGIGEEIDNAIQHAAQPFRHSIIQHLKGAMAQRHNGAKVKEHREKLFAQKY
jgi:hypothetical protein